MFPMVQVTQERDSGKNRQNDRYQPVLLSMGANLDSDFGPPRETIQLAIRRLTNMGVGVNAVSHFYQTPAYPPGNGPDFVNVALTAESRLTPDEILVALGQVEHHFGRVRDTRWGARVLDIDLLGVGQIILPNTETHRYWRELGVDDQRIQVPEQLILPHPRLQERAFVLIPLADVAPNWRHPVLGITVDEMVKGLPERETNAIIPI